MKNRILDLCIKRKIVTGSLFALLLFSNIGSAQVISLQQVLDSIETRNPGLQQFNLQTKASNALKEGARAWSAPEVGAGLSEFPYGIAGKSGTQTFVARQMLMVRLQQMFPNFDKQKKEGAYYGSLGVQNQDDKETMQNMLFAKAKVAYYDVIVSEKKLQILDEQSKQLQLLIQIAEGRLAYNKATLPDIYSAQAKLSEVQSMSINMHSSIDQSTAIINSLMNSPLDASLQIDTSAYYLENNLVILPVDSEYLRTHRSDIMRTSDEIHSMHLDQKVAASESNPQFGITWDNMRMNSGMYMYSIMGMVTIPIAPWSSKGYKSQGESMGYQIDALQKKEDSQVLETLGNIRKDWLSLQASQKDLRIFETEIIPAVEKTYHAYLNAFSENTGNIYETLKAWDDLTTKRLEYFDKVSDLLNIRVMLETEMQKY